MADLRKLKDDATQAFAKGKFAKAVDLFDELVKADPKDFQAQMKLGDALVKANNKQRAVTVYQKVAEAYANGGFLPKAIAACKVILEIDPKHNATQQVLAGLYAKKLGTEPGAAPKRPSTAAAAPRPPSAAVAPVAPPPAKKPELEIVEDASDAIELDTGDHAQGGFGAPAPVAPPQGNDLPPELDPSLYDAPATQAAPPPPPPPEPERPLPPPARPPSTPAQAVQARPPTGGAVPAEIEVPLELDIELSATAAAKVGIGAKPDDDEPLSAPEPAAPAPAPVPQRPQTRAPSMDAWGNDDADSIEAQLSAVSTEPAGDPTPLAPAATEPGVDEAASIEVAFDVPMADSAEEEIEVLSVTAEVPKDLGKPLPKIPLFSDLTPEAFVALMEQCGFIRAEPGQVIIKQGDAGNSFFVVCSGKMKVVKQDAEGNEIVMAYLAEGAFFGEMALLSGLKRTATVVADEESDLLEISAPVLNNIAKQYPHVVQSLRQFGRQRLLADVMATSALFRPFDRSDRKRLVELFKVREVGPGELVVKEGTPTDGLYLVMNGELEVKKAGPSGATVLATLKEGDIFGEMSLLSKKNATATVGARKRSNVLRLPRERFEELIVTYPQVLVLVSDLADSRTRANAKQLATTLAPDAGAPLV
ncbi:MAG: cyclic nucleotide-binding domain-containing protein [Deltaproteobacteria bacterium]|nr:cyclic nucleotide-binding domain-containing protein [Deltaproteobacteria bacterium]